MKRILLPAALMFMCCSLSIAQSPFAVKFDATEISCNCYQLTENDINQHGSVWNKNQLDLTQSFDFTFKVYLGDLDGWGADGMSFVLQQDTTSVVLPYGNPGHHFLVPSLAVELDQFFESENGDLADDHLAILANGSYDHNSADNLAGPVDALLFGANIDDGVERELRIVWDAPNNTMDVYFSQMFFPILTYTGDIVTTIFGGDPLVYWGFTGGSGGIPSEHRFCFDLDANAAVSATSACIGEEFQFTSSAVSSLSDIQSWFWDFDNDSITTQANAAMAFDTTGVFNVQHVVSDVSGCEINEEIEITVESGPEVEVMVSNACQGLDLEIENLTLGAQSFEWSFSDGQTSSDSLPQIIMSNLGSQSLTLVAESSAGCADSTTVLFNVNPTPQITLALSDHCLGEELPYNISSSIASGSIDSVHWNMDDGSTYVTPTLNHTYDESGTYTVVYSAISDLGCVQTTTQDVEVEGTMPEIVEDGDTLTVTNGPFVSYQWFINGNPISGAVNNSFVPMVSGNVSVVATDASGCAVSSYNIEFTISTGVAEQVDAFELMLLPNPNNGRFTIKVDFGQPVAYSISVKNVLGQKIIHTSGTTDSHFVENFELNNANPGLYFLHVDTEIGKVVRPFIISY